MEGSRFDMVVVGSGPAGQKAAIQAAKVGASVAVVERRDTIGGVCANTGTIPSKTLREAAIYLTGLSERGLYGQSYRVKEEITIEDLVWRTQQVMTREVDVIRNQLARNHVRVLAGQGRLAGPNTVEVSDLQGGVRTVQADRIVIATGTTPARPPGVEFDEATILDSDGILLMSRIPSTLVVVGAGVIGIEYASIFAALGTRVTVVEKRERLLEFCDNQMVEALQYYLRDLGVVFRLGETVTSVEKHDGGTLTALASGKRIAADAVMYSAGRQGATADLGLDTAGLTVDSRGRIEVDEHYRTSVEHIYAVGDVIGFPSLASASFEQGRLAAAHAFGLETRPMRDLLPIGIYTVPEISFAGLTEEELTGDGVPYEIGISRYRELARGQILGDSVGILKLLVAPDSRTILGVHVFGTAATELVHIGQTVMGLGGTVDYLIDQVFNYPTLAESYKVAALDATNKLRALNRMSV
ncbi:MAG TPA: Si-specific NAD(P)(+) transhydrogenase [Gaiellales bacterium]|jgi:NAD(P) transhydrogenase